LQNRIKLAVITVVVNFIAAILKKKPVKKVLYRFRISK